MRSTSAQRKRRSSLGQWGRQQPSRPFRKFKKEEEESETKRQGSQAWQKRMWMETRKAARDARAAAQAYREKVGSSCCASIWRTNQMAGGMARSDMGYNLPAGSIPPPKVKQRLAPLAPEAESASRHCSAVSKSKHEMQFLHLRRR